MERSTTIFTLAAVTVATGFVAYAVYFDYRRRNDADFRKKLRKEKKRVDKSLAQSKQAEASSNEIPDEILREALLNVKNEPAPSGSEAKEAYFMHQVSMGEQLVSQGPAFHLPCALAFFKALRVYPSPVELINIYEKTVPAPVFKIVMQLTNLDVTSRVEGYYKVFPPKSTNVSVTTRPATTGTGVRSILVLNKDVAAGEVIYKESPIVVALDADVQAAGTHCTHCFRRIESNMAIRITAEESLFPASYCSKPCLLASKHQSHSMLFTLEAPIPEEIAPVGPPPAIHNAARKAAQSEYVEYVKKEGRSGPLLAAQFIARQVVVETQKLFAHRGKYGPVVEKDFTDAEGGEYYLADHLERLRYLEVIPNKEELPLLAELLHATLPGLEQFTTPERHATLLGKMAYNAFGVCFAGGREDKPAPTTRPEDVEKTRTPYGTQRQIGSALYTVSSYLTHSCKPSARPSFPTGTSELHLIANCDLKKGDELTVAYVDVTQRPDESVVECRRRRRIELARGWRFACPCERCVEEGKEMSVEEKDATAEQPKDESKVEASVKHLQEKAGQEEDVE